MQVQQLGRRPYPPVEAAMGEFTAARGADTEDELWLVEHDPVYTQGIAGQDRHVLDPGAIPVLRTSRGGQVTYHGPGQVVAYPLVNLRRLQLHIKDYVYQLEDAVLRTLADLGVTGHRVRGAPGIYVRTDDPFGHDVLHANVTDPDPFCGLGKIAALGIKVSRGCAFHGLALNVAMDLRPFTRIDPCGHAGLRTVDLQTLGVMVEWSAAAEALSKRLLQRLA
ncbi:MAG: lipoyl(octanoyl) transferase LipB [Rubrivivax sp.]